MDHQSIIFNLEKNRIVFQSFFSGVSAEEYRWKPSPDKWCLLEVLCHLYDEEREDFRTRVRKVLEDPTKPLPSIDPAGWVNSRNYKDQDYFRTLEIFLRERQESIRFLGSLQNPKWYNAFQHVKFGPMSAELFLSNWLAHDYLHFKQIVRLKYQYLDQHRSDSLNYAGDW